jgi:flagellar biosynthesis/type III secretory pathway protein FliH
MVTTLMETNRTTEQSESSAPAPVPRYVELQQLIAGMQSDFEKFYRDGNKAAGTRVRNAMQELKTLAQTIRTEVQAIKNEGKASSSSDDDQPD